MSPPIEPNPKPASNSERSREPTLLNHLHRGCTLPEAGCRLTAEHASQETWLPENLERSKDEPLHATRIENYALLGDLQSAALVSHEGSIDWLCWPTFSSPACFASLLGTAQNGFFRIRPAGEILKTHRAYREGTMILETTFLTGSGEVLLTDCMPPRGTHSDIIRKIRCIRGTVAMRLDIILRFDYGLTVPWVTRHDHEVRAVAGPNLVVLRSQCIGGDPIAFHGEDLATSADFTLGQDHEVSFVLSYGASNEDQPPPVDIAAKLRESETFWTEWSAKSTYNGPYAEAVQRSLITLKALTFIPTGGIVAAPTVGLPEQIGGERNWDYRYCWLRDAAFTLLILMLAGYTEEAVHWRLWLLRAIAGSPDQLQTLYGINGERRLPEWDATWLAGYENSRPVRIGNAAADQFQLDVYGEVAAALSRTPDADDDLRTPAAALQAALTDHLCKIWPQPDDGIWETRGDRKQFVHSKAMAWVALDRAIQNHEQFDGKGDLERWKINRDLVHKEVCEKGFNKELNAFTQSYGSDALDASCLRMVLGGFLPPDDPRILGTIDAIQKNLMPNGLVNRYDTSKAGDGLKGDEGTFLACSFWMVTCLHLAGRKDEAKELFERLLTLRNDVGLLSEEYDPKAKRQLGNFPQALSHLGLVHAAFTLSDQWKPMPFTAPRC